MHDYNSLAADIILTVFFRLIDVLMDEGVSRQEYSKRYPFDHSPQDLLSVEQCICEPSYQGMYQYHQVEGQVFQEVHSI